MYTKEQSHSDEERNIDTGDRFNLLRGTYYFYFIDSGEIAMSDEVSSEYEDIQDKYK